MALEQTIPARELPIGLTQLDIVLPEQYFAGHRKQKPEHRLMMAVLQDALECLAKHRNAVEVHARQLFRETESWFLCSESRWPYSFEAICGVLDLDADAVRKSLRVKRSWAAPAYELHAEPRRILPRVN